MERKRAALWHFMKLNEAVCTVGGEALMNVKNFVVDVRLKNGTHKLYPQFFTLKQGKRFYAMKLTQDFLLFAGWRPDFVVGDEVPEIGQKLKFKKLMRAHGFRTPEFSTDAAATLQNVLVKQNLSAYGNGIKGPFHVSTEYPINGQEGEFYERYMEGESVKVWYVNATPVCGEAKDAQRVVGDGKSTIRELAKKKIFNQRVQPNWTTVASFLSFYDKDLDTSLKSGETQVIDFKYASEFCNPVDTREFSVPIADAAFQDLNAIGQLLAQYLPRRLAGNAVYTVDAVLDKQRVLWFLEVNFNPFIHPDVYPSMIAMLTSAETELSAKNNQESSASTWMEQFYS